MTALHSSVILLYAVLAGNLLLAVAAGVYAILRRPLPVWFWSLLVLTLLAVLIQIGVGGLLLGGGARPRRALHLLYGLLVAAAGVVQYGLRPGGFLRRRYGDEFRRSEARVLALVCLTQFALLLRAWMTGMAV